MQEVKREINEYVQKVIELIEKEIVSNHNPHPKAERKYIYNIPNHQILNHPRLPFTLVKTKSCIYMNEYEKIYPITEIVNELRKKYPNYEVNFELDKYRIIIKY
jgi:hypothetical protein